RGRQAPRYADCRSARSPRWAAACLNPSISPGQRHDVSLALHVHSIEEAHAEQRGLQTVAFQHYGFHVVNSDAPVADRVELDEVARYVAICRPHHRLATLLILDRETTRLTCGKCDQRRAGIDDKGDRPACHVAIGSEMAPNIGREHYGFTGGCARRHARVAQPNCYAFARNFEGRAIALHGNQDDPLRGFLPHRQCSQRAAINLDKRLVGEQAGHRDVCGAGAGGNQEAENDRYQTMTLLHDRTAPRRVRLRGGDKYTFRVDTARGNAAHANEKAGKAGLFCVRQRAATLTSSVLPSWCQWSSWWSCCWAASWALRASWSCWTSWSSSTCSCRAPSHR